MPDSPAQTQPIYHLVSAKYYADQSQNQPYLPETFAQEGFIHCTAGLDMLIEVANRYFAGFSGELLVLQVDPLHLTAPLKFEPPIPPPGQETQPQPDELFPHIYGPLNRAAITVHFYLQRDAAGHWQLPQE